MVVVDGAGGPVEIVTDQGLRARVVAEGRDASATPSAIMSAPLVTLPPAAFAFEGVAEMTRRRLRHIVVVEDGRLLGVVSGRDLLGLQTAHPVMPARDLDRAGSVEALAALSPHVAQLVRRLVERHHRGDGGQRARRPAGPARPGGRPAERTCWSGAGSPSIWR